MKNIFHKKRYVFFNAIIIVAIFGILFILIFLFFNPLERIKNNRNAERLLAVNHIANDLYQYYIDNDGNFPEGIPLGRNCLDSSQAIEICRKGLSEDACREHNKAYINYLTQVPDDPQGASQYGSGYFAIKTDDNHIIVCAPYGEGTHISIQR